jgi:hypothetical protein
MEANGTFYLCRSKNHTAMFDGLELGAIIQGIFLFILSKDN